MLDPKVLADKAVIAQEIAPVFKSSAIDWNRYGMPLALGAGGALAGGLGAYLTADEKAERKRRMLRVLSGVLLGGGLGAGVGHMLLRETTPEVFGDEDYSPPEQGPAQAAIEDVEAARARADEQGSRDRLQRYVGTVTNYLRENPRIAAILGGAGWTAGELGGVPITRVKDLAGSHPYAARRSFGRFLGEQVGRATGATARAVRREAARGGSFFDDLVDNIVTDVARRRRLRVGDITPSEKATIRAAVGNVLDPNPSVRHRGYASLAGQLGENIPVSRARRLVNWLLGAEPPEPTAWSTRRRIQPILESMETAAPVAAGARATARGSGSALSALAGGALATGGLLWPGYAGGEAPAPITNEQLADALRASLSE